MTTSTTPTATSRPRLSVRLAAGGAFVALTPLAAFEEISEWQDHKLTRGTLRSYLASLVRADFVVILTAIVVGSGFGLFWPDGISYWVIVPALVLSATGVVVAFWRVPKRR